MKFEIKTQKEDFYRPFTSLLIYFVIISLVILISNISIKLGSISRYYEINFLCKLLVVDKSTTNFKRLSKLLSQTSKQKTWEICKEVAK
tara:strand:+ start:140 stop:406 length:267 start_codon:yes stop_codon:yes gene_type:complete